MNKQPLLEVSLLLIFLVDIFKKNNFFYGPALIIIAVLVLGFIFFSFTEYLKLGSYRGFRFLFLILIILGVNFGVLLKVVYERTLVGENLSVHDGVIMVEAATDAFLSGLNPYSISYREVFESKKYLDGSLPEYAASSFPYSPLMFLVNIPIFSLSRFLFDIVDVRIGVFIFYILSGFIGLFIVREKVLFFIIFLLNPLFFSLAYYGANEAILLFFFVLQLFFLYKKKILLATVILALSTSTKLLILPFVPIYFLYIYLLKPKTKRLNFIALQFLIFVIVNLLIYLPFLIWNSGDLVQDLVYPWVGKGEMSHPIAGYLGIPQVLSKIGLISIDSSFPFFIFIPFIEISILSFAFYVFRKSMGISTLCVLVVFNFILFFMFSRLLQVYYLAFLSQILVLSSFLNDNKQSTNTFKRNY